MGKEVDTDWGEDDASNTIPLARHFFHHDYRFKKDSRFPLAKCRGEALG